MTLGLGLDKKNKNISREVETIGDQIPSISNCSNGLTPVVTTSHESMKHIENDEYFILFMHHFPYRSPVGFIHQHPI